MTRYNFIAGLWKFKDTFGMEKLQQVAQNLESSDPNHAQVFIRRTGAHEMGIAFIYKSTRAQNPLNAEKKYLEKTSIFLKAQAGKSLIGWEASAPLWILK